VISLEEPDEVSGDVRRHAHLRLINWAGAKRTKAKFRGEKKIELRIYCMSLQHLTAAIYTIKDIIVFCRDLITTWWKRKPHNPRGPPFEGQNTVRGSAWANLTLFNTHSLESGIIWQLYNTVCFMTDGTGYHLLIYWIWISCNCCSEGSLSVCTPIQQYIYIP